MGRLVAAALVAGAIFTTSVSTAEAGTIGIDFGCTEAPGCGDGDDPLQSGYVGWVEGIEDREGPYNEIRSFNSDFGVGGTFNFNITSDYMFFREYVPVGGSYESLNNLLTDMILRNTAGSIVSISVG